MLMAGVRQRFSYEATVVPLGDTFFNPLQDAIQRWEHQVPPRYDSVSLDFDVVYELADGRFVYLRCQITDQVMVRYWFFWRRQILIGPTPAGTKLLESWSVAEVLIQWEYPVPAHLQLALTERPPKPAPQATPSRDLSQWAGKGYLSHEYRLPAHGVQPLDAVRDLIDIAIPCIQQVREWSEKERPNDAWMSRGDGFCWEAFGAQLFRQYAIDPATWWGDQNTIPPATIGLHEFPWKLQETEIVDALRVLRKLLEPMLVVLYHRYPLSSADNPSPAESQAAFERLIITLPEFETQILRLKAATSVLQTKIEQLDEEIPKGASLKQPSDRAMVVYRLWFATGARQEDIAEKFKEDYGLPMEQGSVSRYLNQVKAWVEAGNILPAAEQSSVKPIIKADSPSVDLGANQTGRTPRQRERKNDGD